MIALKCKNENNFLENLEAARSYFVNNQEQRQNSHYLKATEALLTKLSNPKQELETPLKNVNCIVFTYDENKEKVSIQLNVEVKSKTTTTPNVKKHTA